MARGQQRTARLRTAGVFAGNLMKGSVSLEPIAVSDMSVLDVLAPTPCPGVLKRTIPLAATLTQRGVTPVRVLRMLPFLEEYPNREAAVLLRDGFSLGFHIPCSALEPVGEPRNLISAMSRPDVVFDKLSKEVGLGRMAGPFSTVPIPGLRVSPLGVVPKKEANKFRLIHHLSHPAGGSVNDGIDESVCKVSYTSFDAALSWVRKYGRGSLLAKTDIESAFRLLPVHPASFYLLGCKWEGQYFVDKCLPMGCSISCALFETFSTFLEWVVKSESGIPSVLHYLDDFLFIGPPASLVCKAALRTMERVSLSFGVPLAPEKTEGPATVVKFLGIVIDADLMECRLPDDKLVQLKEVVRGVQGKRKLLLKELQSLVGRLNFACRIIPIGRVFCRRLSMAMSGVRSQRHYVRLSGDLRADLQVWSVFLDSFNGRSLFLEGPMDSADVELFTDASGAHGFGAYLQGSWCAGRWPQEWRDLGYVTNLALLELFPIVVAVELWGDFFRNKKIRFMCDNLGVVQAINQQTAGSRPVVSLLRFLVLKGLSLNALLVAKHIPGVCNGIADALSRFQMERFRNLAPSAAVDGIPCPGHLWKLV